MLFYMFFFLFRIFRYIEILHRHIYISINLLKIISCCMLKIDFEMERVDCIFGCNEDIIFVLKEKEKEEEKLTNFCNSCLCFNL